MRPRLSLTQLSAHSDCCNSPSYAQTHLAKACRASDGWHGVLPDLGIVYGDLLNWRTAADIGLTYRQCFSLLWQRSSGSTRIKTGMCARESELFDRVANCFPTTPLTNYWWGGQERPSGFLIRIREAGPTPPDEWDEDDWVRLVLEHLCDDGRCGLTKERAAYLQPHLEIPLPRHPGKTIFDVVRFQHQCRAQHSRRWRDLARAIQVVAGVGNVFLEPSPNEEPVGRFMRELGFSVQAVQWLERQWDEAQECLHALCRTTDWLGQEPERWREVFALWSSCQRPM